jgi:hypothetical protein
MRPQAVFRLVCASATLGTFDHLYVSGCEYRYVRCQVLSKILVQMSSWMCWMSCAEDLQDALVEGHDVINLWD